MPVRSSEEYMVEKKLAIFNMNGCEDPAIHCQLMEMEGFVTVKSNPSNQTYEVLKWANKHTNALLYQYVYGIIVEHYWFFNNPREAVLFKLRWG